MENKYTYTRAFKNIGRGFAQLAVCFAATVWNNKLATALVLSVAMNAVMLASLGKERSTKFADSKRMAELIHKYDSLNYTETKYYKFN